QHCIDYFEQLMEDANASATDDYDMCEALKDANKYICDPRDLNDPDNDPDDTTPPDYTEEEMEQFDCLTELNILVRQYAAAIAEQETESSMQFFRIPECGRIAAGICCQRYLDTVVWECQECPEMTVEDCNLGNPADTKDEWIECMNDCHANSEYPNYGEGCLDHFLETGEWYIDCMYWTVECDCNEFLDTVPAPDPEVMECLRSCTVPGVGEALEYYDATGNWKAEYDH